MVFRSYEFVWLWRLTCASICFWWLSVCRRAALKAWRGVSWPLEPNLTSGSRSGTAGWDSAERQRRQEGLVFNCCSHVNEIFITSFPVLYAGIIVASKSQIKMRRELILERAQDRDEITPPPARTVPKMIIRIYTEKQFTYKLEKGGDLQSSSRCRIENSAVAPLWVRVHFLPATCWTGIVFVKIEWLGARSRIVALMTVKGSRFGSLSERG